MSASTSNMLGKTNDDAEIPDLEEIESDDASDWEEEEEDSLPTECLFCGEIFMGAVPTLKHCYKEHEFNIDEIKRFHSMDCFGYIKMINYIRKLRPSAEKFKQLSNHVPSPWNEDIYMKPEVEDDSLLQFDIEEMDVEFIPEHKTDGASGTEENGETCDVISVPIQKYRTLMNNLKTADDRVKEAEDKLQQAVQDLHQMRQAAQNLVLASSVDATPSDKAVQHLQDGEDESYIDSYSHFSIHQEMLQDKVRTESYRDAILNNRDFFKDKVVLDIGCGTGILSMFAAKAGAKKVVAVDMSDVIYQAMDIVRENNLDHVVTLVKGRLEDVDMPEEEFDIIISEWMGYFLLFESMLDTVLYARDRWLKPEGKMMPDSCSLYLTGSSNKLLHERNVSYWDNVYGFQMTCMRTAVVQEASVLIVNDKDVATDSCLLKFVDVCNVSTKDLEFTSSFHLTAKEDCCITALVGYFDIYFNSLENKISFSTSPAALPTHWKQTVFLLHTPIQLTKGESLDGQLICQKNKKDPRSLKVFITIDSKTYVYLIQ